MVAGRKIKTRIKLLLPFYAKDRKIYFSPLHNENSLDNMNMFSDKLWRYAGRRATRLKVARVKVLQFLNILSSRLILKQEQQSREVVVKVTAVIIFS